MNIDSSQSLKLIWTDKEIGTITDISGDYPWMSGTVQLTDHRQILSELFDYLTDEDETEDPPFDQELLNDENWQVEDSKGIRKGIFIPAIYTTDNTISWRWR